MAASTGKSGLLYGLTRLAVKIALKIFFQEIDVRHRAESVRSGPAIFVANHPNSIMDALVLGVVAGRKINYLAHAGLFTGRLKGWFLKSCGVIPVHRRQDDPDLMHENANAFAACSEALERGEAIGIFPEGTSDLVRKIKKVKTGAARILLETEARNAYRLGIKLIPVGLYFYSISHFRSRVLANFGAPVDTAPFIEIFRREGFAGARALTAEIQRRLEELTVHVHREELDGFVRDIESIYRDELKTVEPADRERAKKALREDFVISRAIAECVAYYYENAPDRLRRMQEQIANYKRKLSKLHLRDAMLRESTTPREIWRGAARTYALALIGLLPAAFGIINNFIPYRISEMIARRFSTERTKILSALLIGGGTVFSLFYAVQIAAVFLLLGGVWAILYALALPIMGFFALAYIAKIRRENERVSMSFFLFSNRQLIAKMRRQRRALILQMNQIRNEYAKITAAGSAIS